ncbi:MAG: hypothetical protein Q8M95_11325 [Candidatus Methanoperedens sp.]|nr:hypothetical protein [Candidatus Methanoperedens sp.]
MANTNRLKKEVEPEIINLFCKENDCNLVSFNPKSKIKEIFLGMDPDLVAYDKNKKILYIGEITTSGYDGNRGNFHIGAVRKFAEIFSKFYLCKIEKNEIFRRIEKLKPEYTFESISCHLIVPKGSKFIKALGYRKKLLETGIMSLDEISLSDKVEKIMHEVLDSSRSEMKK